MLGGDNADEALRQGAAGDLIHIDIKRLARVPKVGRQINCNQQQSRSYGVAYEKIHGAV